MITLGAVCATRLMTSCKKDAEREQREADERRRLKEEEAATGKTAYQRHLEDLERRAAEGDPDAVRALAYHKKLKK